MITHELGMSYTEWMNQPAWWQKVTRARMVIDDEIQSEKAKKDEKKAKALQRRKGLK